MALEGLDMSSNLLTGKCSKNVLLLLSAVLLR